jgi:acyl carrier protein
LGWIGSLGNQSYFAPHPTTINSDKNRRFEMDDLKDIILKYVIEEYGDEDDVISYETPLISGGLVDSFSLVSLKRFLEVKYKISIPDDDASPEAFDNINKIADLVRRFTS